MCDLQPSAPGSALCVSGRLRRVHLDSRVLECVGYAMRTLLLYQKEA